MPGKGVAANHWSMHSHSVRIRAGAIRAASLRSFYGTQTQIAAHNMNKKQVSRLRSCAPAIDGRHQSHPTLAVSSNSWPAEHDQGPRCPPQQTTVSDEKKPARDTGNARSAIRTTFRRPQARNRE